jgi:hypothetical protein
MKKVIILCLILFAISIESYSQGFKLIADIKINTAELSEKLKYVSTQFIFKSKDKTPFYNCFDAIDIIEPYLKAVPQSERKELVIIAENAKGDRSVLSYSDFDLKSNPMPIMMIYKYVERQSTSKKEILIKNDKEKIDEKELESVLHMAVQNRRHLQMQSMTKQDKDKYFTDASLLVISDLNANRWIEGANVIKIYQVEKSK